MITEILLAIAALGFFFGMGLAISAHADMSIRCQQLTNKLRQLAEENARLKKEWVK